MKKMIVFFLIVISVDAHSQIEGFAMTTKEHGLQYDLGYAGSVKIGHNWRLAYTAGWELDKGKALAGLTFSPFKTLKFTALIAGFEIKDDKWSYRYGGSFFYEEENKFLVELMAEKGRDAMWYRTTLLLHMSEKWDFGVRQWTEHGIGIMAGYKFSEKVMLCVIPVRNFTEKEYRLVGGLTIDL